MRSSLPVRAAVLALGAAAAVASAPAAAADEASDRSDEIAEALAESPVYVDPVWDSVLTEEQRDDLAERIDDAGLTLYVVLVPLVNGDPWQGEPEALMAALDARLGDSASYLTADAYGGLYGRTTPQENGDVFWAAASVFHNDELADAPVYDQLQHVITLVEEGRGEQEYDELTADLGGPSASEGGSGGGQGEADQGGAGTALVAAAAAAALLAAAGSLVLLVRRRRRPPALPSAAFATAAEGYTERLAERARRELVEVGEELVEPDEPAADDSAGHAELRRALDAYHAAGKVVDAARTPADWAGALVLIRTAREEHERADAIAAGREPGRFPAPCFFHPLHEGRTKELDWRPIGQRRSLRVPACPECAAAVRGRRPPNALADEVDGAQVPYFEVDAERSLWAATGYGALRDDLVQRVLGGGFRRAAERSRD
ncbi:hypothetical protein [Allonocardiopsis opalescens]|uniref:MYXO-CTERM domain-containing protein n=1 Tax=Allonocardiopsis opalescens TaxID=1144618 RepID=A0A2T0PSD8_9ACTN|nr:hypothetical protein [Allonocardiopsis opalescens]PRX91819.1 hypothetical protein CLV72_1134 [Allonocardiopsis opalescens]